MERSSARLKEKAVNYEEPDTSFSESDEDDSDGEEPDETPV